MGLYHLKDVIRSQNLCFVLFQFKFLNHGHCVVTQIKIDKLTYFPLSSILSKLMKCSWSCLQLEKKQSQCVTDGSGPPQSEVMWQISYR